jgi:hypothetical protein
MDLSPSAHSLEDILHIALNLSSQLDTSLLATYANGFGELSSNTRLTVEILSCNTPDTGV